MKCNKCEAYHPPNVACPPPVSELEQCPHCDKFVRDVYQHTSTEECDVIREYIQQAIGGGVPY